MATKRKARRKSTKGKTGKKLTRKVLTSVRPLQIPIPGKGPIP